MKKRNLFILFTLLGGMLSYKAAHAAPRTLNHSELRLLNELKRDTINVVEKQKREAIKLRECFADSTSTKCDSRIKSHLSSYRRAIRYKNEEYRLLTALSSGRPFQNTGRPTSAPNDSYKLNLSTPGIHLRNERGVHTYKETDVVKYLARNDVAAMNQVAKSQAGNKSSNPYFNPAGHIVGLHLKDAAKFYKLQAIMAVQNVPFVVFLKNDQPTDKEIATSISDYIATVDSVIVDMKNLRKNPLETFLIYEPVVRAAIKRDHRNEAIVKDLLSDEMHKVGIQAWVDRNSMSLKFAALTTCSFVGAILQSWPVSVVCTSALTILTSKQLYSDYVQMRTNFAFWLSGTQSYNKFSESEGRTVYSSLALLLAGQGMYTIALKAEGGLIATLNELPENITARFSSLTAMREGTMRFAVNTTNFKGKDLGASIFAESATDNVDTNAIKSRRDRIFSYSDLLRLQSQVKTKFRP